MVDEFDMKLVNERWVEAWDLRLPAKRRPRR